ncbi:MAG TPA: uroporphyrinogen-III synthase [Chitinophagaceae bacterium]|jgi:uroporphyrinogen-III synthase|nr:uroporphyrinogen-III synthase [Chitinophagaceae bacterium]
MSKFIPVLSTKRLKPDIIRQALLDGLAIIDYDFISISFSIPAEPISFRSAIIFTSKHAVQAFVMMQSPEDVSRIYKTYCLDGETRIALESITGIEIIATANDAFSLATKIAEDQIRDASFICGHQRRSELPDHLRKHGVKLQEIKLYHTQHSGHPVKYVYKAVLFFSPSAVESFFQTNILAEGIPCFCIGKTTAAAARECTDNPIIAATETTQESMIASVKEYFKTKKLKRSKHRDNTTIDCSTAGVEE